MKKFTLIMLILSFIPVFCACAVNMPKPGADTPQPQTETHAAEAASPAAETASPAPTGQTASLEPASAPEYEITYCHAKTWIDTIGTIYEQTIVEITNTGTKNLYLFPSAYKLMDVSGKLVANRASVSVYPNVLAPGEKGYMYDATKLNNPVEGELTVVPCLNIENAKVDLIRFPVTGIELSEDESGRIKMLGQVENIGEKEEGTVYIVAFLYTSDGVCVGDIATILPNKLAAGDKIDFEMFETSLPDDVTLESIADYVIYAYPVQFQF